ncbi:MAG: FAD-dependent oxidoreductase, partial [Planctomycetaceae bacterium]
MPAISIVVASRGPRRELEAHLQALLPQSQAAAAAIVVARAGDATELRSLCACYPTVRFVSLSKTATVAELRSAGMADAAGDIVTLVDDAGPIVPNRLAHLGAGRVDIGNAHTNGNGNVATATTGPTTAEPKEAPMMAGGTGAAKKGREVDRLKPGDRVVIIGAGPGGLTPAYLLAKRGIKVTVLEADDVVGGISRTAQYNGYRFDIGGHRFFTKIKPVEDLWHELLGDEFISVPRLSRIHYQGKFFDYPLKAMNALRGLGLWNALLMVISYVWAHLRPSPVEDNLEQWVTNRFGKRLYRIFFKTYTEKVWGIPCTEIRAEWAAQRIQNLSLARAILS